MQPISPNDVTAAKAKQVPPEVIKVFNDEIVRNWTGRSASVKQKDVLHKICEATGQRSSVVFENKWMDIEDLFRSAGWVVTYDSPSYCESYDPYWVFEKPRSAR